MKRIISIFFILLSITTNYILGITPEGIRQLKIELAKANLPFVSNLNKYIDEQYGITLLMYASDRKHTNLVKLLLESGAHPLIKNKYNATALDYAINRYKKDKSYNIIIKLLTNTNFTREKFDLNLVGIINPADGLGQIALGFANFCIEENLNIKFFNTYPSLNINNNISPKIKEVINKGINVTQMNGYNSLIGPVSIFTLTPFITDINFNKALSVLQNSIKLAYSMIEYTDVPKYWVEKLNNNFDGLIVPDEFWIEVYKKSGVIIPIFVLPLGVYHIDDFLKVSNKTKPDKIFKFGCSAYFCKRKNYIKLIDAFSKEFKNNNNVILYLHGRGENLGETQKLQKKLNDEGIYNIKIMLKTFTKEEYIKFMSDLDCYVFISKGEGFSITPRESLACGIPCILTNNTAHKTICNSGFVYSINADIVEKAECMIDTNHSTLDFNCLEEDLRMALRNIYENYESHLSKFQNAGREWVKQYRWENLKYKYINLIKPNEIILGDKDIITDEYLMTSSHSLYKKYKEKVI